MIDTYYEEEDKRYRIFIGNVELSDDLPPLDFLVSVVQPEESDKWWAESGVYIAEESHPLFDEPLFEDWITNSNHYMNDDPDALIQAVKEYISWVVAQKPDWFIDEMKSEIERLQKDE